MHRGRIIRAFLSSVAAMVICLAISPAESAELRAIPSFTLEGRWDSNVFNATNTERADYVLTARPGLTLALGALGTTFNLQAGMMAEKYSKFDELDRTVAAKSLNLYPTDPIQVTPALQFRPAAYYSDTTDSRGQAITMPVSGAPGAVQGAPIDLTTVSQRTKEKEYAGSMMIIYKPLEKIDMDLRGSALKHEYVVAPVNIRDFRIYTAGATVFYRLTPKLQAGPAFGFEKMEPVGGTNTRILRESLAGRYSIRETQLLEVRGGSSQSRQETQPPVTTSAPYGFLSLDSTWGTLHTLVSGEYGIVNEGVLGVPAKRFNGQFRIDNRFTPQTSGELASFFQKSWLGEPLASQTYSSLSGSLTIRYQLYRWAAIRLGASHFKQTSTGPAAGNIQRDSIFLGIDLSESYAIY